MQNTAKLSPFSLECRTVSSITVAKYLRLYNPVSRSCCFKSCSFKAPFCKVEVIIQYASRAISR